MSEVAERTAYQTLCRMCNDHCALNVYIERGHVVHIDGYEGYPWDRGRLCSKRRAAADLVYHPPLKGTRQEEKVIR